MRITQNMIYNSSIRNMNASLARYQAANEQNSSQKSINRPSDDPSGYAEARRIDGTLKQLDQYSDNITVAKNWLNQADSTLLTASTVMTSIKELATQAATGTLTDENRLQIAQQVREYFDELVSLSNTSVSGNSLFAGQKTGGPAYTSCLNATVRGDSLTQDDVVSVGGDSDTSLLVEFTSDGTVGTDAIDYKYSADGGATWTTGTLAAGEDTLALGGASVKLRTGAQITETGDGEGTSLIVRPSAVYLGDDQDGATVRSYGSGQVNAAADGVFSLNVSVRIDSNASLPGPYTYSYSMDGGQTWNSGNVASGARIPVPGGYLTLSSGAGNTLAAGDQFTIVPDTADISVDISPNGSVVINNVGKDIFGGLYQEAGASNATVVFPDQPEINIFETVGELIGYLEVNDMDGVGACLEKLTTAQSHLETELAGVGARENRLESAETTLEILSENATARLSDVEDADLSQLLIDLSKYQYAYESVLSSSSKIMQMSILNYI